METCSGFFIVLDDQWYFVTAGHVFERSDGKVGRVGERPRRMGSPAKVPATIRTCEPWIALSQERTAPRHVSIVHRSRRACQVRPPRRRAQGVFHGYFPEG